MNVLLTGATGFLGSHLLDGLIQEKYRVTILKRSTSDLHRIVDYISDCQLFDVDCSTIEEILSTSKFDVVIHCATAYGRKQVSAKSVLDGNLLFPVQLLENAIINKCPYFINTDTFFCKQLPGRLNRNEPLYMPEYTLSKHQFREWGKLRSIEGKITFINLQMEHIYGPNDAPDKFVPWLEKELKSNVPFVELTDGIQLRDFIYVKDVVDVYLSVLRKIYSFQGYQSIEVGTGKTISIRDFVKNLKQEIGSTTELRFGKIQRKREEIMYSTASMQSSYIVGKNERGKSN